MWNFPILKCQFWWYIYHTECVYFCEHHWYLLDLQIVVFWGFSTWALILSSFFFLNCAWRILSCVPRWKVYKTVEERWEDKNFIFSQIFLVKTLIFFRYKKKCFCPILPSKDKVSTESCTQTATRFFSGSRSEPIHFLTP